MASVGGLLGTAGGANGTGFASPTGSTIQTPVTDAQAQTAYQGVQNSLQGQQSLLTALQGQNGIQNQSQVYNQLQNIANGQGPNPAQAMLNQATGANTANQAALMAGQRGASQNTGMIARQAAMQGAANQQNAAGQGATMQANQSLNALGQMQGSANTMAGQQIGATQNLTQSQQNEQANLLNAIAGQNNANVGMQSNINNNNAALAGINMQGQQNLMGGMMQGGGAMSGMMGAAGGQVTNKGFKRKMADGGDVDSTPVDAAPNSNDNMPSAPENSPAPTADPGTPAPMQATGVNVSAGPNIGSTNIPTISNAFQSKSGGGGGGGMSSLLGLAAMMAEGGRVGYDGGGYVGVNAGGGPNIGSTSIPTIQNAFNFNWKKSAKKPQSSLGQMVAGGAGDSGGSADPNQDPNAPRTINPGVDNTGGMSPGAEMGNAPNPIGSQDNSMSLMAAEGGKVPALVSPGERYLPPEEVNKVMKGQKSPLQAGEKIPGKPKHPGNDYRNDVVPKDLDEGGFVIPNKILQGPNSHWEAMKFIKQNYKGKK